CPGPGVVRDGGGAEPGAAAVVNGVAATVAAFLFDGLPTGWQVVFTVDLAVVLATFLWNVVLFGRSGSAERRAPDASRSVTDTFSWVFLVPALNEELTIVDSVARLLAIPLARRRVLVIDDASDDATPELLAR